ncbi:helix-turn-helix transcriptional regulator [Phycicoccus sp. HDW14]|uniref:helix-turn-helix domain-containing protein n=1 Tax=Phycicoccus sp. HDW14 TaxID=2714941 RepID=UPI00140DA922|nr:helix-turn-helix transcriptional regulator [Phycicoccus sp. HDW14]QIM22010.1 helix-turn-helix transcriptional regulator [Phycicoccus sp. HDW14]
MPNDRLRSALASAGMTADQLGERIEVDPKTVNRWVSNGRMPHRSNRQRVAAELRQDEAYLWPEAFNEASTSRASQAEVVGVYPNRGSIPITLWQSLFNSAVESIEIVAFAASFLHDTMPDVDEQLTERARAGVRIRLAFGDPSCAAVALRGDDERIGPSLSERCRLTWKYIEPLLAVPEIEARMHATTLYCSMFRFDGDLLANHHLYGAPANHSPVLHLRRVVGGRLFDHHMRSFERIWASAATYAT